MFVRRLSVLALATLPVACAAAVEPDPSLHAQDAPATQTASQALTQVSVTKLLVSGGIFAESSYMACIAALYAQGLPFRLIYAQCATDLSRQGELGFGDDGKDFMLPGGSQQPFAAGAISAACGGIDPKLSKTPPVKYQSTSTLNPFDGKTMDDFGGFTYGKSKACDSFGCYQGLSEPEASDAKQALIEAAYDAEEKFRKAAEEHLKDPNNQQKKDEMEHRKREYEEAKAKAQKDPNKKPIKAPATPGLAGDANGADDGSSALANTAGESTCALVLQSAREFLAECHRTGWKNVECQQLHAKMNGCPDPTLIYVDPDSGYACAPSVDSEAVIEAWVKRCEQTTTAGPNGGSPCSKPNPSALGLVLTVKTTDICQSPIAHTDPAEDGCIAPLVVDDFGQPGVEDIIVWGQGVFGGPIVVLPPRPLPFPH